MNVSLGSELVGHIEPVPFKSNSGLGTATAPKWATGVVIMAHIFNRLPAFFLVGPN
jgi:hypothetical protein